MDANDGMEHWLPVAILFVQEFTLFPPAAISECSDPSFEPLLQPLGQHIICGVAVREQRNATRAGNRQCIKLRRLEWVSIISAIGMPALGATSIDRFVQLSVGIELVHAEQRDLRHLRMPGALR